jgi:hypothetical protein
MLVMTLPSRTGNGTAESVLAITCQGTAADCQGAVVDHQGATANCQHTDTDCHGSTVDRQGVDAGCQDVADLAALRPKKALTMRCVDGGGHRS